MHRIGFSEPHTVISEWLNSAQVEAINRVFARNPDGAENRPAFFARVENYGDYVGFEWCGMFLGVEKDGYTHS